MRGVLPPQRTAADCRRRDLLLSTWPGRLFLISAGLKLVVAIWRAFGELPSPIHLRAAARRSVGLAVAVFVFVWRLFVLMKRRCSGGSVGS